MTYCKKHGIQKVVGNWDECEQCLIEYKQEQMDKIFKEEEMKYDN